MIPFGVNDFVVVDTGKKDLVKILQITDTTIFGVSESMRSLDHVEHKEIDKNTIIANLGTNPKFGKVYGNNIEIFKKTREVPEWGAVKFFRSLKKEERKTFEAGLKHCALVLRDLNIEPHPFETELRGASGKWSGAYHFRPKKKDGKSLDKIVLRPKYFDAEFIGMVFHEQGHGIWYRKTSDATKAKWIIQYQKAISLRKIELKRIKDLLEDFFKSQDTCKGYLKSIEDLEDRDIFKQCLKYAAEKHLLEAEHLDLLVFSGKNISRYFTIEDIKMRDIELVLTEYARESVEEFFAEAFSLFASGKILPKNLQTLMDSTLTKAANFVDHED